MINAARQKGGLAATDLQQFRSTLRTLARETPDGTTAQAVRGFWKDAEAEVTQALESQLPPKAAAQLQAIDQQFGKFATVRDLATSVKDRTPTMNDWSNAIARNTPDKVYAAGGGWNRGLIQAVLEWLSRRWLTPELWVLERLLLFWEALRRPCTQPPSWPIPWQQEGQRASWAPCTGPTRNLG